MVVGQARNLHLVKGPYIVKEKPFLHRKYLLSPLGED